jgi:NADPH-dependent curcumin reductase
MDNQRNLQVTLAARPNGDPKDSDFALAETAIPELGPNEMLVRAIYLSLDPYMRLRMNAVSHMPVFELGKPIGGMTVSTVVKSNLPDYRPGDIVLNPGGWSNFALSDGRMPMGQPVPKLDPKRAPLTAVLSVLGNPGFTAYVGLLDIAQPKSGETVIVSGAAGAVGSVAGQIAKIKGCTVVGIAGGERKCAFLTDELGFDAAVDYKRADFAAALRAACPKGADIYYENVGGAIFDAVLPVLNKFARVAVCGNVAEYNVVARPDVPDRIAPLMLAILGQRLTFRGFVISDHVARMPQFREDVGGWLREGRIKYRDDFTDGIENAPRAFQAMLKAQNFGKPIVRLSPDPTR